MENIIDKIIKIEDNAQKIISDAQDMEKSLNSDINEKVDQIRSDIESRVEKKYETIQKTELQYADKKIKEIERQYAQANLVLEDNYKSNKEKWINEIYNSIIGS